MAGLGIGIRTCRLKIYDISFFNISEEEAESFAINYDGLDIWNSNKKSETVTPLIEKRVRYLHFLFIPIFALAVEWTTRKNDGLLYITNEKCERKILISLGKIRTPWYFNILGYMLGISLLSIILLFIFYLLVILGIID